MGPTTNNLHAEVMSPGDFDLLSGFISSRCGIKLPPAKKTMLEGRLRKRLRSLGLDNFAAYCDYLFSQGGLEDEGVHMVDMVTTNKTDFFREPQHFHFLTQKALPELTQKLGWGSREKRLKVWSAGCATGEEPYTLAMFLREFGGASADFHFSILATDISTRALEKARLAIYEHEAIEPVPLPWRKKYLLRSKDKDKNLIRIAPELRSLVHFRTLNFMDDNYRIREPQEIIFCRNVLIYFNRPTQLAVLKRLCRHLRPGGYLFIGHSETLHGLDLPLGQCAPTIYRKT
ncbi:MAG: protein-glutamate O-methyltransferase [Syntrophales bacterium]|nr:protein-glutamate O-methyltransferase [Syntrophales bacterium]MDD5642462.1 protein-glutamate O-methyltransferase [Syntrophales bacterium]